MTFLDIAEIIGIAAFALSGFWVAVEEKLDLLGLFIISFLTALGGGIIRDVIVNKIPYSFINFLPSIVVILVILIALILKLQKNIDFKKRKIFIFSDSIGLVSFSVSGSLIGLDAKLNYFGVVLLALITAVGGGILRDVLLNRVPMILKAEFYGTIAIIIGTFLYIMNTFSYLNIFTLSTIFILGLILRLLAYFKKWHLPKI
ncbi:trimeric intracellular cation channel family protein [Nitrosophilus kaiyonis]|uniref:trimeric intracellular cation channel family protein n=1 Tax=Nitrosophilus kaiyonis TaxID=2930200 RepID=UPI0024934EE6|nr:trimeric intracellular cation channel family protein [Nitrosophilus kaiyonis]